MLGSGVYVSLSFQIDPVLHVFVRLISGCEYGDRSYQCRNIEPFDCYVDRTREICCDRCAQYLRQLNTGKLRCIQVIIHSLYTRRYLAEILPMWRKTLFNKSIIIYKFRHYKTYILSIRRNQQIIKQLHTRT